MLTSILFFVVTILIYVGWLFVLAPAMVLLSLPLLAPPYYAFLYLKKNIRQMQRTDDEVTAIVVIDDGDPIVNFSERFPNLKLKESLHYMRKIIRGRQHIGEMLMQAEKKLGQNYHLLLIDCYRSKINELGDTKNTGHQTGGAFDITLTNKNGQELDLGRRHANKLSIFGRVIRSRISKRANYNRQVLAQALSSVGFINHPTMWWNWSYGDQYWCAVTKAKHAIYAEVT